MKKDFEIKLETSRLFIVPLNYYQLLKYLENDDSLEIELGLISHVRILTNELIEVLKQNVIPTVLSYPEYWLYATLWVIIKKDINIIIGDIGFKGAPGMNGLIEIGYGIYPEFVGNGFMTEAVSAIKEWAFDQPGVKLIFAQTHRNNFASQRILVKNGFFPFREVEDMFWWKLENKHIIEASVP